MAKFKPRGGPSRSGGAPAGGGGGGGGNQAQLMQQLQKLQEEMKKTQESLADESVRVTAGGGLIEIVISGHQRIQSLKIKPEAVDPDDPTMLEDLVLAAVNDAIERSQALAANRMEGVTGGSGLGGLGLPGL